MKVLHVYRTYHPDQPSGIAEAIRQTCLSTRPLGIESTIFVLSPTPERIHETPEARLERSKSWAAPASCDIGGPQAFRKFGALCAEADVVHYHYPWPFGDLLHLTARHAAPAVVTWHSDIVRQKLFARLYRPLMDAMLRRVTLIAATSPPYAQSSETLARDDIRDRVRIVPLGVEESSLAPADDALLGRLGISEPFILFLGAMRYYKGIDFLLEAARCTGIRVVMAGGGPELPGARRSVQAASMNNVTLAGHVTEGQKTALLRNCRAVVLPSHLRSEAYGMALVEAALCEKPMISCDIGTGTSHINLDGITGFVVPPRDPQALASAMQNLINDEDLALRLGRVARARYEELFSGQAMGRNYSAFYQEAVSAGKRPAAAESIHR